MTVYKIQALTFIGSNQSANEVEQAFKSVINTIIDKTLNIQDSNKKKFIHVSSDLYKFLVVNSKLICKFTNDAKLSNRINGCEVIENFNLKDYSFVVSENKEMD